jgi:diaminohydroxyphosphoribosylaminopyrimidine deaminase / 5-amino-6-(5-phosphoribosylamino)uracil reductase
MTESTASPWMDRALALAVRGAGLVSPNPMVGAGLVRPNGEIIGEGGLGRYGGPHAEVWAVRDAKRHGHADMLRTATLVVSLEPCTHYGKTPPCVDMIIEEGIPRVVVAMRDPNPNVAGRGLERLREAGVEVSVGVGERAAMRLNEAYVMHVRTGLPLVTLKLAQTLDGRVASRSGDSRWVSSEAARARVHRWRAESDAVLVGALTARFDDPELTVRHSWPGRPADDDRQPMRVVLDRAGILPADLNLFGDAYAGRTVAVVGAAAETAYEENLAAAGGILLRVDERNEHLDLPALFGTLGRGLGGQPPVQSVLVEAGPSLATALLKEDLVDRLFVFTAPKVLGEGLSGIGDLGSGKMAEAFTFAEHHWEAVGEDMLFRGYLRRL